MLIDRERQRMGWLNPFARPFIPSQNQESPKTEETTQFLYQPQQTTNYNEKSPQKSYTNIDKEKTPTTLKTAGATIEIPTKYERITKILALVTMESKQGKGSFTS